MKAWQFTAVGAPLSLIEREDPTAASNEVVIETKAAGVCHTDVGYTDGALTKYLGTIPIVLGHEIAGDIVEIGSDVTGYAIGDRVVVKAGQLGPGSSSDGGYSTHVRVAAEWLLPIPDGVSYEQAAVATDAGLTAYHALTIRGHLKRGDKVGIIGAGGLGHLGIQFAIALGATVYVAEVNEAAKAASAGYDVTAWGTSILDFADENLDVIIDYAGFGVTTNEAVQAVKFQGRVVLVGIGVTEFTLSSVLVGKEVDLVGSLNGSREDLAEVLEILARGDVKARLENISFEEIPAGLERLSNGQVRGRLVAVI